MYRVQPNVFSVCVCVCACICGLTAKAESLALQTILPSCNSFYQFDISDQHIVAWTNASFVLLQTLHYLYPAASG